MTIFKTFKTKKNPTSYTVKCILPQKLHFFSVGLYCGPSSLDYIWDGRRSRDDAKKATRYKAKVGAARSS